MICVYDVCLKHVLYLQHYIIDFLFSVIIRTVKEIIRTVTNTQQCGSVYTEPIKMGVSSENTEVQVSVVK